ncbi:uncharacterized protein Z519_10542 [Cladophialophora bantiana CBS 173.52]|uniref:Uncharacterized protein n=1 Tax=Cladophialophora bantiana (strain ATCC 10958 / CBS 173.52 / CDC B-1940 / NIH 8579) TaxID=1442370 RepID=A0A0D2FR54_CLAB1|nr:uncharacterized protein Z519_10542 [Cladophialophora bantiana CBS 173.52]KIW89057.1 hypothetical protein Z519_10542 [Cladophialophora bantiana CBS 173.52]
MPPVRTPPPQKSLKTQRTQRTQEENVERAYIAASRRNDRTLEARVESARRASEVHKRRTGRALRITPEDVMNDEMYEEEGDDLPTQYRRLTAHLQTGSADFNRRFAAYLTHQVAVRSAIAQMAQDPHGQWLNGGLNMFPSPMQPQHGMALSPGAYQRPAPYPLPHQANLPQNNGRKTDSLASALKDQEATLPLAPAPPGSVEHGQFSTTASTQLADKESRQHVKIEKLQADLESLPQTQCATMTHSGLTSFPPLWQNMGPFTTSLPPDSQQMLAHAPGFDVSDPFYAMLMHGSDQFVSNPYYPWRNMHGSIKDMSAYPLAYQGIYETLAPAALESPAEDVSKSTGATISTPTAAHVPASAEPADPRLLRAASPDFVKQESREPSFVAAGEGLDSGQATPSREGFWDYFVRDGSWEGGNDEAYAATSENNPDSVHVESKVEVHD